MKTQANLAYKSKGYENSHEKESHKQQHLSLLMGSSPSLKSLINFSLYQLLINLVACPQVKSERRGYSRQAPENGEQHKVHALPREETENQNKALLQILGKGRSQQSGLGVEVKQSPSLESSLVCHLMLTFIEESESL